MSKLIGYEEEVKNKSILSIQMNLLNKCTSRCISCKKYTWPNDAIKVEDVKNTLKVLKEKFGLRTVLFSGGDPILYKGLEEVIAFCVDNDIKYSLITTLITNNEELLKLIAKTAYRIHVSVDGANAELYRKIRGVNGLANVEKNIDIVMSMRPADMIPIRISATIGIFNYNDSYNLYQFAKIHNCIINFYFLHTWDDLKMNEDQIQIFKQGLVRIKEDEKIHGKISNARSLINELNKEDTEYDSSFKKCYLPFVNASINANGDIYPCCKLLDDNGEYTNQMKYAYGNISNKTCKQIEEEFNKRLCVTCPLIEKLREDCARRYGGSLLRELEIIIDEERPVFFL